MRFMDSIFFRTLLIGDSASAGFDLFDDSRENDKRLNTTIADGSDFIVDVREFDVPYHVRVTIDRGNTVFSRSNFPANNLRYPNWKMVYGGSQTWRHHCSMYRGPIAACRPGGNGIRYRDY